MARRVSRQVRYEETDGVGVWIVENFKRALESGGLEAGQAHFRETVSDGMKGTVVVLEDTDGVDAEVLGQVGERWADLCETTPVEATAYVSTGVAKFAISSENGANIDTAGFSDRDEAVKWAKAYQ